MDYQEGLLRPDVFGELISFDQARAHVLDAARAVSRTERLELAVAAGRVMSSDVTSPLDVPAFDRAAMDGYAVRAADVTHASAGQPVTLQCIGRGFTGSVPSRAVAPGECQEIATGAPLPAGADAVVMVEQTSRADDTVTIAARVTPGQNIGRRGADIMSGQPVGRAGDWLRPANVGALAAIGVTSVDVFVRPTVAVISTGNELTAPGAPLPPGHVYDVNQFTIRAVAEQHGGIAVAMPSAPDAIDALVAALQEAAVAHDVIVCSGGSSVGGRDLLVDAVEACGRVIFHGIAVKPGKPTLFGTIGMTPIFGMPGNPTSCLSNAYLLLVPFLRKVARLPPWRPTQVTLPLAQRIASPSDRHQFFAVRVTDDLVHAAFKSSGDITSLANADGYIEIGAGVTAIEAGSLVTVTYF